ncbi:putative bifunctional diguanylate cyclase/phosphodiesterase [Aquipuribacter hungaricus]|uniref:Bifunctional diguanylate cyclase/phosphodiesterase n=1 Tax=Aquipuribacter hungaricus TaxID=545624 RepID=A0ABV7WDP4_9MICO
MRSRLARLLAGLDRWLHRAVWLVLAFGLVGGLVSTRGRLVEAPADIILTALSAFFGVVVLRLLVAAVADRERRAARLVLLAAVCLWAAGSAALHQGEVTDKSFPGPAEYFFLPAYVGFVAFLSIDSGRARGGLKSWLETSLMLGAMLSVAAVAFASPLAAGLPVDGTGLLLFLLYPLLDFGLLLLLAGQLVSGARGRGRDSSLLLGGTALLVGLDLHYAVKVLDGGYYATLATDVLYGVAFALLATGACSRRSEVAPDRGHRSRAQLVVLAAVVALVALGVRPAGAPSVVVTVPAILTLVAVVARLMVALREAQGAAEALRLSRTDELTGLRNRRALLDDLRAGLQGAHPPALLLMDLDRFKEVNDGLGHSVGDQLLQEVARRLELALPPGALVARLGGDEFAAVLPDDGDLCLLATARRARRAVSRSVTVGGVDLRVGASVGVARGTRGLGAVEVLRRADVAMYQAKQGRSGESLYDPANDDFTRDRLQQVELLRAGIEGGQLRLWYQPLVSAATQRVVAVEALVRWEHPVLGLLQPVSFLPEARRAGLMPALTEAVVGMVLADAVRWHQDGHQFQVGFNCAPPELLGEGFLPHLGQALDRAGLPAGRICVEVTEDSFVTDPERARRALQELSDRGVVVAIDDYGTGFSSLAYLRDLPVHSLKLDRSFMRGLQDEDARTIVESTLQMAHALRLELVTEGVEDAATAATLVAMGVDVLQGYHFARPMPPHELDAWVQGWEASLSTTVGGWTGPG